DREVFGWQTLFLTHKAKWQEQVEKVRSILSRNWKSIAQQNLLTAQIETSSGETLPGGLDPIAFKGLRGKTLSDCNEKQLKVDSANWALACLGGAIATRYKWQRSKHISSYFAIFPTPQNISFGEFREIKKRVVERHELNHMSVETSAAHYAVLLADEIRKERANKRSDAFRFGSLHYFTLASAGQQFKVTAGGNFAVNNLVDFALKGEHLDKVLSTWDYLFRVGSVRGEEEVAEAITHFVMHPSVETYEAHIKAFLRRLLRSGVKEENLYDDKTLLEAMRYAETF
ncbi:MAG: hypothetical protein N2234_10975, partial [Planctomycetota bacterium]|nr:hypothetical protein [Planctomycetota bacterium]